MKKSEANKILFDAIYNLPINIGDNDIKEIVDEVLRVAVEKIGMLPPPDKTDVATSAIVYCYYDDGEKYDDRLKELKNTYGSLDIKKSILWEPENE